MAVCDRVGMRTRTRVKKLFNIANHNWCQSRAARYRVAARLVFAVVALASLATPLRAETLNWNTRPATNFRSGATDTATINGVTVTTTGAIAGTFAATGNILAIAPTTAAYPGQGPGHINTTMDASNDTEATRQTVTFNFSEPVYNLSVTVGDIDGGANWSTGGAFFNDIVEFRGVTPSNATVLPTAGTPVNATRVTWTAATGRASANGFNVTDNSGNVTVTFAGPLRTLTIAHIAGATNDPTTGANETNPTTQFTFIDDIIFTRSPRLTVQKTSQGAVGAFNFSTGNVLNTATNPWSSSSTTQTLTTVTQGTTVTSATQHILFATATNTNITETVPAGWSINPAPVVCTDSNTADSGNPSPFNASVAGGVVTVAAANVRAGAVIACNVTNERQPTLTLVKSVTNDNGGTNVVADFTLTATGATTITGTSGTAAVTNAQLSVGTYTLSESGAALANYTAGTWSCPTATMPTATTVTLAAGQNITCTITNNDRPRLTLLKSVTNNNGGTAADTAFTLTATGPITVSGTEGAAAITNASINAGTYVLSETGPAGYAAGAWSCVGGTLAGANLTLAQNQNATCTIVNDDIAPVLTLIKTLTNNNGGTSALRDFQLTATGPTTITGPSGAVAVTSVPVNAGTYTLTETGPAGYAASAWVCTAGTLTGNSLVLALGQTATCTINNDDIAPRLTLVKTVTDLSGGPSTVSSFTLTATGPTPITGITGAAAVTNAPVNVGTYTLSEAGPAGYTAGNWTCTAGTLTGASLVLALGQTATCTINNIKRPTVQLRKISNGGIGTFTYSGTNGFGTDSIATVTAGVAATGVVKTLAAASAQTDITETVAPGFFLSGTPACTGLGSGGTASISSGTTLRLSAAATSAGATIVCTFSNTLAVPAIQLSKTPTPTTVNARGQSITYAIVVTNNGNVPVSTISISDPLGSVVCATSGNATIATLAPSASENCTMTYVTTQNDLDSRGGGDNDIDNTVNASGTYNATVVPASASAAVTLTINPLLNIVKTKIFTPAPAGGDANGNGRADAGDVITYSYAVSNTGNVTMNAVGINDAHNAFGTFVPPAGEILTDNPPLGNSTDTVANNGVWSVLAPGDVVIFSTTYTVTQQDVDLLQ